MAFLIDENDELDELDELEEELEDDPDQSEIDENFGHFLGLDELDELEDDELDELEDEELDFLHFFLHSFSQVEIHPMVLTIQLHNDFIDVYTLVLQLEKLVIVLVYWLEPEDFVVG